MAALAVILLGRISLFWWGRFTIASSLFALLIISIFYGGSDYFTDDGINEAVLYHLKYGLEGAGFGEYAGFIVISSTFIAISIFISSFVFFYLSRGKPKVRGQFLHLLSGLAALGVAFIINPGLNDIIKLSNSDNNDSHEKESYFEIDENFVKPLPLTLPPKPVNFIYIYLESLERSYFVEKIFPDLVPGLKELEDASLSFTQILQVTNTGWTIAGVTASQCGIPLATTGVGNSMAKMDQYLPGAVCIGDLLKSVGYKLHYMGGASLQFAGKGKFYTTHGFSGVSGLEELRENLGQDISVSEWGIYDPDLLQLAEERFLDLSEAGDPFGLFLLTLDTHHPKGHIPEKCMDLSYGDGSNEMLNSVHCSDMVVSEFIKRVRESDYSDNTVIVVGSDHLAFRNLAYDQLSQTNRTNLFFINYPGQIKPARINKIGTTLDIGPTLLTQLGFNTEALGLGKNLLGNEKTIIQKKQGDIYEYLRSLSDDLISLWDFPQLNDGLLITPDPALTIKFGDRSIRFPALISINDDLQVQRVTFGDYSPHGLIDHVDELEADQPFIWIDSCRNVSTVLLDSEERLDRAVCVAVGSLDAEKLYVETIETKAPLLWSKDKLTGLFSELEQQESPDDRSYSMRKSRLEKIIMPSAGGES